ncbi:UDP-glucose 4-epimerase GalE [Micrococcus lylae]|uniref:UDP-glucose 4-epimerase GalE n=1 Tax=Micrococcus lylae TaxID=1273 RepID=UPI0021A8EBDB|nr:UDP-glucose 4-epimerase GalE [Micrococcus lylae]MCT2006671.1 UDP-glucose 4-epimerase GalE [Micrococcus lylae]MCT2070910.1 UDP-glucose 4-epimerase GalE [Micrococcus lylae]
MRLLVTGGAGYIGSHFVSAARRRGLEDITVVDDLSTGLRRRVPAEVPLHEIDLSRDSSVPELTSLLRDRGIDVVVHFAAKKVVGDSVVQPEEYFRANIGSTVNLLTAMRAADVDSMVFSSSAAVYGEPEATVVYEDTPTAPINPYGQSKLVSELALENAARAWGLRAVALRYFNVAGAESAQLADTTTTNLMPAIRDVITRGDRLSVFGADYDTVDGTCVRDYVHVVDLAEAHLAALPAVTRDAPARTLAYNVGTGQGSSVLEIVEAFRSYPGITLDYDLCPRRPGDPGALTADVSRIAEDLGWTSRHSREDIVASVVDFAPPAD